MSKKRMEIIVETTRVFVAGGGDPRIQSACESCGGQALMIPVDQVATAANMSLAAINSRIAAGEVHIEKTSEGSLLVCLNSLLT